MKAILLDGSRADDRTGERVSAALLSALQAHHWEAEHVLLRERKIGNCAGDFFCWIRSPGVCNVDDDNRPIAEAVVASDLMVYLTPVTFGGYSSVLKRMVDHQIQNVSPFFATVAGETHHQQRYPRYPDFLAVGWMDGPDARAEAIFRHLTRRNAINFFAERAVTGVVPAGQPDEDLRASAHRWLDELRTGHRAAVVDLPAPVTSAIEAQPIRRAVLLVGSPRTRNSTSAALGGYLFERLAARSVSVETIYLHTILRSPEKTKATLEAVEGADLVTLAFPLYVDSLPAPVIEALERITACRQGRGSARRSLFSAIANCGFPEAHHNATALAICETFAGQAGFEWGSALAVGGGQAVDGRALAELGGRTVRIRKALDLAADALGRGAAIPAAARDLAGKPGVPVWLYRLLGEFGWKRMAKRHGVEKALRRQPYSLGNVDRSH